MTDHTDWWSENTRPGFIFLGHREPHQWVRRDTVRPANLAHDAAYAPIAAAAAAGTNPSHADAVRFLDTLDAIWVEALPILSSDVELKYRGETAKLARMLPDAGTRAAGSNRPDLFYPVSRRAPPRAREAYRP